MIQLWTGESREVLAQLPERSVQCVVTSPPYFGLRDYGVAGQIGLEPTVDAYVAALQSVFQEVWRVLRDDGTLWLNLGDSYAANRSYQVRDNKHTDVGNTMAMSVPDGLKPKDLIGIPWRVALALQADGWYLRSDIVWSKPNPMPESVKDRPTHSHEYLFLLPKKAKYFYDHMAIAEPIAASSKQRISQKTFATQTGGPKDYGLGENPNRSARKAVENFAAKGTEQTRNARSVWTIATTPFPEAHFAVMPVALADRCIRAGSSEKGQCPECGAPWKRTKERTEEARDDFKGSFFDRGKTGAWDGGDRTQPGGRYVTRYSGWQSSCKCDAGDPIPQIILDPFSGAGTTALAADRLGRHGIGIDLSAEFNDMAERRIRKDGGMFVTIERHGL